MAETVTIETISIVNTNESKFSIFTRYKENDFWILKIGDFRDSGIWDDDSIWNDDI